MASKKHGNKHKQSSKSKRGKLKVLPLQPIEAPIVERPSVQTVTESQLPATKLTAISMHLATQFHGSIKQGTLFSDNTVEQIVETYSKETGLQLRNKPDSYGVALSDSQKRVFFGILKAFSDTNYTGHYQISAGEGVNDIYTDTSSQLYRTAYKNAPELPVIRLTQSEIVKLASYDIKRQGDKEDAVQALTFLASNQFCFYWSRLAYDKDGKPEYTKDGKWKKEIAIEVGTLLRVKEIRDEETGSLKYYEIHPSSVILDQVSAKYGGNYFLLIPHNWQEEVKKKLGKRASRYTYELLLWLRVQFEEIRRHNSRSKQKKPFVIKRSWEEVAQILKMPETVYKRNKATAIKKINEAYSGAKDLGYLTDYKRGEVTDILYLNEQGSGYYKPGLQDEDEELKKLA